MTEVTQTSKILTQNFVTVPRKVPEGPLNVVGLTRSSLREALIENGTPEKQANMRVLGRYGNGYTRRACVTSAK